MSNKEEEIQGWIEKRDAALAKSTEERKAYAALKAGGAKKAALMTKSAALSKLDDEYLTCIENLKTLGVGNVKVSMAND